MKVQLAGSEEKIVRIKAVSSFDDVTIVVDGSPADALLRLGPLGIQRIGNVDECHGLPLDDGGFVKLAGEMVLTRDAQAVLEKLRRYVKCHKGPDTYTILSYAESVHITLGELRTLANNK